MQRRSSETSALFRSTGDESNNENRDLKNENDGSMEFKFDSAEIRGFTLMFDDAEVELRWNLTHLKRHLNITIRYLFIASCFQGLFYWGDLLEHTGDSIVNLGYLRLILGIFSLLMCFLVSTGLLIPTQITIWWINICYGLPTLALFYFAKTTASPWDCLFLIYGLCFFMLPKISPLNFIFGFSGAALLSFLFIYISAYRLSLQQWLMSNTILMVITTLFCYMTYSSERACRERWLLRERLRKERINFRISVSSLQHDYHRTVSDDYPFFPMDVMHYSSVKNEHGRDALKYITSSLMNSAVGRHMVGAGYRTIPPEHDSEDSAQSTLTSEQNKQASNKEMRMALFYKGIGAWAICYGMGYAFDVEEVNKSAAFALLMHSMGFSTFLMVVTGQIRWLALNGVVGLAMLWIFNQTGMDNRWVVFSTHSVGYVLLAVVIVVMILVFGGVVLVWTHLIDFLKDVLIRHPEVKDELAEDRVLEQVLIRYISDIPKSAWLNTKNSHVVEVYKEDSYCKDEENTSKTTIASESSLIPGSRSLTSSHPQLSVPKLALASALNGTSLLTPPGKSTGLVAPGTITAVAKAAVGAKGSSKGSKSSKQKSNSSAGSQSQSQSQSLSSLAVNVRSAEESYGVVVSGGCQYRILQARRPKCCYFCLKTDPTFLVPACPGWTNVSSGEEKTTSGGAKGGSAGGKAAAPATAAASGIPMCTPYTEMIKCRDDAIAVSEQAREETERMRERFVSMEAQLRDALSSAAAVQGKYRDLETAMAQLSASSAAQLAAERRRREEDVQSVIAQHNHQLAELKRLHKSLMATSTAASGFQGGGGGAGGREKSKERDKDRQERLGPQADRGKQDRAAEAAGADGSTSTAGSVFDGSFSVEANQYPANRNQVLADKTKGPQITPSSNLRSASQTAAAGPGSAKKSSLTSAGIKFTEPSIAHSETLVTSGNALAKRLTVTVTAPGRRRVESSTVDGQLQAKGSQGTGSADSVLIAPGLSISDMSGRHGPDSFLPSHTGNEDLADVDATVSISGVRGSDNSRDNSLDEDEPAELADIEMCSQFYPPQCYSDDTKPQSSYSPSFSLFSEGAGRRWGTEFAAQAGLQLSSSDELDGMQSPSLYCPESNDALMPSMWWGRPRDAQRHHENTPHASSGDHGMFEHAESLRDHGDGSESFLASSAEQRSVIDEGAAAYSYWGSDPLGPTNDNLFAVLDRNETPSSSPLVALEEINRILHTQLRYPLISPATAAATAVVSATTESRAVQLSATAHTTSLMYAQDSSQLDSRHSAGFELARERTRANSTEYRAVHSNQPLRQLHSNSHQVSSPPFLSARSQEESSPRSTVRSRVELDQTPNETNPGRSSSSMGMVSGGGFQDLRDLQFYRHIAVPEFSSSVQKQQQQQLQQQSSYGDQREDNHWFRSQSEIQPPQHYLHLPHHLQERQQHQQNMALSVSPNHPTVRASLGSRLSQAAPLTSSTLSLLQPSIPEHVATSEVPRCFPDGKDEHHTGMHLHTMQSRGLYHNTHNAGMGPYSSHR